MALEIRFDFRVEGQAREDAFLDPLELDQLFEGTRRSMTAGLKRKFQGVVCAEHGVAPSFVIRGTYQNTAEELDIQYHVDACCQAFLLRVMRILNRRA